eukprot:6213313-Pleurochrysis_carterae.AAC.1
MKESIRRFRRMTYILRINGQHVLDGVKQLVVEGLLLLAVGLRVEPLPKFRADSVAFGRVEGDIL